METIIKAHQPWWRINLLELWEYRDLLRFMVRRDFSTVYKQTILGPLWFIIQPLLTTLVFTVIFGHIARISTDGLPPAVFYMSAMMLWNYFAGVMNGVSSTLMGHAGVFSKVYFPRLIPPLALLASQLIQLGLNLALFLVLYACYGFIRPGAFQPTAWVLALPLLVLQCAITGLGTGLWMAAMTVQYRDLRFALPFFSQLWMYATPIVYPASLVPQSWNWVLLFNPMAGVIEFNRYAFFGTGTIRPDLLLSGAAIGLLLCLTGLLAFNRAQRTFVDTI